MANTIEIIIKGDVSDASRNIGGLQDVLGGLGRLAAGALTAGLTAAAAGFTVLGAGLVSSLNEAMKAEEVQAALGAVLQSTGGVAGVTAEMANELASSLQGVTRFSDEAVLGGENLLLTFTNIGKDIFPEATQTMLDMSQALGQDLKSSAIQLGKALQDPIDGVTALRRVGVNFTDAQEAMIKSLVESGDVMGAQTLILKELQTEFGGAAEAAGKTFAGQLDILKNKISDAQEKIGAQLIPVLIPLIGFLSDLSDKYLPQVIAAMEEWSATMQTTIGPAMFLINDALRRMEVSLGLTEGALDPLKLALTAFKGILDATVAGVQLAAIVMQGLAGALEGLSRLLDRMADSWRRFGDAVSNAVGRIPDWLIPGSPTPFERGLRGIAGAMDELRQPGLGLGGLVPAGGLAGGGILPAASSVTNQTRNQFIFNVSDRLDLAEVESVVRRVVQNG